jgi:hypothetical protein
VSELILERVILDGVALAPRSSTLRSVPGGWSVYLAVRRLPARIGGEGQVVDFTGETVGGEQFSGRLRIVTRRDDAYGSVLELESVDGPYELP